MSPPDARRSSSMMQRRSPSPPTVCEDGEFEEPTKELPEAKVIASCPTIQSVNSKGDCKVVISALDGMLQAENNLGVRGNPVAFTVTYSLMHKYGTIDFPEFLSLMVRKMKDADTDEELIEAFKFFDRGGNVFVIAAERLMITTNHDKSLKKLASLKKAH